LVIQMGGRLFSMARQFVLWLKSVWKYWRLVVTSSALAAFTWVLGLGIIPISRPPSWMAWLIFVTGLMIALFRSWAKEHSRVEYLEALLLKEYGALVNQVRRNLSPSPVVFQSDEQEQEFYCEKIEGDPDLIKRAWRIWKEKQKAAFALA